MGVFKNIFTWWEGATFGTFLGTKFGGERVGEDSLGNVYYQTKKAQNGFRRRWVMYNGLNDASRVPPDWHGWLHNTLDAVPDESLPPPRMWEREGSRNPTGSDEAHRPAGALERGGKRAQATGDYEAWTPGA